MTKGITLAFRILFILYIAALSCLCFLNMSFTSGMDVPGHIFGIESDKIVHFLMFLPFAGIASPALVLPGDRHPVKIWKTLSACMAGALFAAFTELVQKYLLPMREGDMMDFLADLTGLAAGLPLYLFILLPFINRIRHRS